MQIICLLNIVACTAFKPIDWESLGQIKTPAVKLEMKTFTSDGLDVETPILAEGKRDAEEFDHEEELMKNSFKEIRSDFEQQQNGVQNSRHTAYVPKLRKLDLDSL